MKYLYMICSTGSRPDVAGDFIEMANYFLRSARKHCPDDVTLLCNWVEINDDICDFVKERWGEKVTFFNIEEAIWHRQVAYHKINQMNKMPYVPGDQIIMLDVDTMVQGPLFDVFDLKFDIAITGRPVPEEGSPDWLHVTREQQPINLGYTAYRWSPWVACFMKEWAAQVKSPKWEPYVAVLRTLKRADSTRMCGDQDFINVMVRLKKNPCDAQVVFRDVGPKYNWYPDYDRIEELDLAWKQIESKLGNDDYRVIHLKGYLKPLALKIAEALECVSC